MIALLLSGGMDSIALAHWNKPDLALTIDYGQAPAEAELTAATQASAEIGIRHESIRVDCSSLGSGDLAGRPALDAAPVPEWWPYRNQMLVTLAAMRAIALGAREILVGSVAGDSSHADGRPEFFEALDRLMALQEGGVRIRAPANGMTSAELIRMSAVPRSLLAWSHSCHVGNLACGSCRGCVKHYQVMGEVYGDPY